MGLKKIRVTGYVLVLCHLDLYHVHGFQVHMLLVYMYVRVHTFYLFTCRKDGKNGR